MTSQYSPAESAVFSIMGKHLLSTLDPSTHTLAVGTSKTKRGRKHIVHGLAALCSSRLRIAHVYDRSDWEGTPDCQYCLAIADFFVTARILAAGPQPPKAYPQSLM